MPHLKQTTFIDSPTTTSSDRKGAGLLTATKQPISQIELTELQFKVKLPDVCIATRQLATLLQAGMNLVPALSALIEQCKDQPLEKIIAAVRNDINDGSNLADALKKHPRVFSTLYVSLVNAGQTSGTLNQVLMRLAEMLEKQNRLQKRLSAALIYPAAMATMAVAVVMFLMAFVIPSIAQIFLDMNHDLPLVTKVLINASTFMQTYFWLILVALIASAIGIKLIITSETGQRKWHRWKLQLPIIGDFILKIETTRFCRTLSTLLSGGIPILNALSIVKEVIQNRHIKEKLDNARQAIGDGATIAHSLKQTNIFAPIMTHTIAVGEMSGQLEQGLNNIANTYDEEIEMKSKTLTSLLEPIIAVTMGLIVGFIVLAILLPIFEINQSL